MIFLKKSITAPNIYTIQFAPHLLDNRICSTIDFPKIDFTHNRICSHNRFPKNWFYSTIEFLLHNRISQKIVSQFTHIFRTIWRSAQYYKQQEYQGCIQIQICTHSRKLLSRFRYFFAHTPWRPYLLGMQKTASKSLLQFSRSGTVREEHFCLLLAETRGNCLLYNFASLN